MPQLFFIYSATVDITNYTIKDIPGSSGRLDVISRCILATLLSCNENKFEKDTQVWIFLEKYGTFIFDSNQLNHTNFPKNELKLTDNFVHWIRNINNKDKLDGNPLKLGKYSKLGIMKVIDDFMKLGYSVYILHENGDDFFNYLDDIVRDINIIFIVGNQLGDIMDLKELNMLNAPRLSFGSQSYIASSIIRLIKLNMLTSV